IGIVYEANNIGATADANGPYISCGDVCVFDTTGFPTESGSNLWDPDFPGIISFAAFCPGEEKCSTNNNNNNNEGNTCFTRYDSIPDADVWFSFEAPAGNVTITTSEASVGPKLTNTQL